MTSSERSFFVNCYQLTAKEWHKNAERKVIACHGWLDNAASFDVLAPLLNDCHIIAMDMPGHGLSDHKSPQANYNIWDDLLDILAIADEMDWETFSLLGHSRGGMMSMLLASVMPDRIDNLVLLDTLLPPPVAADDAAKQLRLFIRQQRSAIRKKLPSYSSVEEAIQARCRASGMDVDSARLIVERGTKWVDDSVCWTSDPRLTTASAFKMTESHNRSFSAALAIPSLVLMAEQGYSGKKGLMGLTASNENIVYQTLPGGHHFHMEPHAVLIAERIHNFYTSL